LFWSVAEAEAAKAKAAVVQQRAFLLLLYDLIRQDQFRLLFKTGR
jgi:hypothetical protein